MTSKKAIFFILLVFATLANNTTAINEEINVSGAVVNIVWRAPFNEEENLSLSYLYFEDYCMPSRYEVDENSKDIEIFINSISSSFPAICNKVRSPIVGGMPTITCNESGVKFTYDGYWVVGEKRIALRENDNLTASEKRGVINDAENEIVNKYNDFKKRVEIPPSDYANKGEILQLIHLDKIIKEKLSTEDTTAGEGEYNIVSTPYEDELCPFLDIYHPRDCNPLVVEYTYLDNDNYRYYIRNNWDTGNSYGKILFIDMEAGLDTAEVLERLFASLDYYRYGKEFVEEGYLSELKITTKSIYDGYTGIRLELLERMNNKLYDYKKRLEYLESKKSKILEKKEYEISEINSKLRLIEKYHEREQEVFDSLPPHEKVGLLLYGDEIELHFKGLVELVNDIKTDIESIREVQGDTTQLYYGELNSARMEQTIKDTHDDNLFIGYLTILTAILAIMFALIILLIQNTSDKYSHYLLQDIQRDKNIMLSPLLIISLMALLLYSWITNKELIFPTPLFPALGSILFIYFSYYIILLINPRNMIKRIKSNSLEEEDENKMNNNINILRDIAINFDFSLSEEAIKALEEIAIWKIGYSGRDYFSIKTYTDIISTYFKNDKNVTKKIQGETEDNFNRMFYVDNISATLRIIGENVAKDSIKQPISKSVITSMCEIGRFNIEEKRFSNSDLQWLTDNNILWITNVFEEIIRNKELDNIKINDIDNIINSLYIFSQNMIRSENGKLFEKQSKQILQLMYVVTEKSKEIPRLKDNHDWIIRTYKDHLMNLKRFFCEGGKYENSSSDDLKNKIREYIEKAEKM